MSRAFPPPLAAISREQNRGDEGEEDSSSKSDDEHAVTTELLGQLYRWFSDSSTERTYRGQVVAYSPPSLSTSSSSLSSSAASPSYTVTDTLWVYHHLTRGRYSPHFEYYDTLTFPHDQLIIGADEARWFYPLSITECEQRFGHQGVFKLMEVLSLVLCLHGADTRRVRRLQRENRDKLLQLARMAEAELPDWETMKARGTALYPLRSLRRE